jgi:CO dehydrogenase/acetyl-CoA synthase delta subunit
MSETAHDQEWISLYGALRDILSQFGTEDPYGDGDYWIVDDNWGDRSHKVEVSKIAFLTPMLIASVKGALQHYPSWRVLLQVNQTVGASPATTAGYTVRRDGVESVGAPEM